MKKKVRVYTGGGAVPYCLGGALPMKKQMGGEPFMTQDSARDDDIPGQKRNSFLDFLKTSTEAGLIKQQEDALKEQAKMFAQDGATIPQHLSGRRNQPGRVGDTQLGAWMGAYQDSQADWRTPLNVMYSGAQQVFSQPDHFKMELPEGQEQYNLFEDFVEEGYQNPQLTSFTIEDYDKAGRRGRDRVLKYSATGQQRVAGEPPVQDQTQTTTTPPADQPTPGDLPPVGSPTDPVTTTHGYMNQIQDINRRVGDYMGEQTQQVFNPVTGQMMDIPSQSARDRFMEQNQGLFDAIQNIPYAKGGYVPKAQSGVFFPGMANPHFYGSEYMQDPSTFGQDPNLSTAHGQMDFFHNLNQNIAQQTGQPAPEYDPLDPGPQDRDVKEEGEIYLKRQSKLKQAMEKNPYLASQATIAGMQLATNIGNLDDRFAQERAIRERVSNVHRFQPTVGADRGDYMVNVPGVGDVFRPDQHTRMGYNTKVAQDGGYVQDQELDLRPEEINNLIAQGYQLEYLD